MAEHYPKWTLRRIEDGHAILMTRDAQRTYPAEFAVDEVIEWEHECLGEQGRDARARLRLIVAAVNAYQPLVEALRTVIESIDDARFDMRRCIGHEDDLLRIAQARRTALALLAQIDQEGTRHDG